MCTKTRSSSLNDRSANRASYIGNENIHPRAEHSLGLFSLVEKTILPREIPKRIIQPMNYEMLHADRVVQTTIKNTLNRSSGFLLNPGGQEAGCSHLLNLYSGCRFGNSLCGVGCYLRATGFVTKGRDWGSFLDGQTNARWNSRRSAGQEDTIADGYGQSGSRVVDPCISR
jgi:hypothetical protein